MWFPETVRIERSPRCFTLSYSWDVVNEWGEGAATSYGPTDAATWRYTHDVPASLLHGQDLFTSLLAERTHKKDVGTKLENYAQLLRFQGARFACCRWDTTPHLEGLNLTGCNFDFVHLGEKIMSMGNTDATACLHFTLGQSPRRGRTGFF